MTSQAMKVVLYFGHHKVGSTALQAFLARNWARLAAAGILYPAVESEGMARNLADALGQADVPGLDAMNVREPHNALAFQMLAQANKGKAPDWHGNLPSVGQMIRALRMQEKYLRPHTILLVSEVMSNFGARHPNLIARLQEIFPLAEFELYCVLRRPDEYLASWHGQRLRFGEAVPALQDEALKIYGNSIHFNYRRMVAPWLRHFEGATAHLRPYAAVRAAGGSPEDFLATVGVDFPKGLVTVGEANLGIPRAAMEIVRRGNRDLPPEAARALVQAILTLPATVRPVPNGDVELFGAAMRARLAAEFAPIHDWLSEVAGKPFFDDIAELGRVRPVPEGEAMHDLLAKIDAAAIPSEQAAEFVLRLRKEHAI